MSDTVILAIDAMGGDDAPRVVVEGVAKFCAARTGVRCDLHGNESQLTPLLASHAGLSERCRIVHTDAEVSPTAKPSQALRRGKGTSMWNAVTAVKEGDASAAISAGNTGALMAISMLALRKMHGVYRPGMTALWPNMKGEKSVVLDVGANLEATASQLVTYAIMGEAYARAITGRQKPSIGLLNIGTEEMKGHDEIKVAAEMLKDPGLDLNYVGFVEGDDISLGAADVVVTDGFTGNVALKTGEGIAKLVGQYVKEALTQSPLTKAGAFLAASGLKSLKQRMNPSNVNGGVLLGLNGVVVKSHGGTDADGFATALHLAADLAKSDYMTEVAENLNRFSSQSEIAAE